MCFWPCRICLAPPWQLWKLHPQWKHQSILLLSSLAGGQRPNQRWTPPQSRTQAAGWWTVQGSCRPRPVLLSRRWWSWWRQWVIPGAVLKLRPCALILEPAGVLYGRNIHLHWVVGFAHCRGAVTPTEKHFRLVLFHYSCAAWKSDSSLLAAGHLHSSFAPS